MKTHSIRVPQRGFTMLEVLISIVVIAFGMLGIAGLQAYALKNSQGASLRSVATVLASDMIDRMKGNPSGASFDMYVDSSGKEVTEAANSSCTSSAGCPDPAILAKNDLFEWHALVASSLPKGIGMVCRDSTPTDTPRATPSDPKCDNTGSFVIKIWWLDDRSRANAPNKGESALNLFTTQFNI
ncbi:MAG TPA: type IV pilus modification protein PilV [Burkholderiales bacterium]|nr:type IV pilus modification protein PilV [Burkholderiales bacterium]